VIDNSEENMYVQKIFLNGFEIERISILHEHLQGDCMLEIFMGSTPAQIEYIRV